MGRVCSALPGSAVDGMGVPTHATHGLTVGDGAPSIPVLADPPPEALLWPRPGTVWCSPHGSRLAVLCAARAAAGVERGGDRSAGPAGGRAARGERSEPP
ncbi:hypothetical protein SSPO_048340 [Streptomyces antimycoticus]|uniref:Uncharacterized protein n=1 Tax=Streptomyces antimycoticus TaxID=68175 RepID=A0A499V0Z6_9ACTN|nr:hypothetical protein SSPO_048340 [Streptomyces antimycoticus]